MHILHWGRSEVQEGFFSGKTYLFVGMDDVWEESIRNSSRYTLWKEEKKEKREEEKYYPKAS